jgi:hypothetical protein
VRANIHFRNIRQAGDGEDEAVPPIPDPWAVGPNHRHHVEPHLPLATGGLSPTTYLGLNPIVCAYSSKAYINHCQLDVKRRL